MSQILSLKQSACFVPLALTGHSKNCGGTNITTQSWLARNMDKQTWEFTGEFSDLYDWCDDSNEETKIYETEIS
jgi:hypothetical protein